MTTKITIENDATSNGDLRVHCTSSAEGPFDCPLYPGEKLSAWITTSSLISITETWPSQKPVAASAEEVATTVFGR